MAKNNEIKFKFDGNQINYEIGDIDAQNAMRATAILLITIMMQTGITVPNIVAEMQKSALPEMMMGMMFANNKEEDEQ
jgi:hypothetical protein